MYWDDILPHASLRPAQLLTLIRAASSAPTRHAAWFASGLAMSLTGAYRWFARWHQSTQAIRTRLGQVSDPPGKADGLPDPYSLRHLAAAFPACLCPAAAFQNRFQKGLLQRSQVASTTFRRIVKRFDLLKPIGESSPKARLAFAKAHANDLWQGDSLHGPYLSYGLAKPVKTYLICFIDDASRVIPHGAFYHADDTVNLIDCFQTALCHA